MTLAFSPIITPPILRNTVRYLFLLALIAAAPSQAAQSLRTLLANDDGFESPCLKALDNALTDAGHDVYVIAPATQQSGASASIKAVARTEASALPAPPPAEESVVEFEQAASVKPIEQAPVSITESVPVTETVISTGGPSEPASMDAEDEDQAAETGEQTKKKPDSWLRRAFNPKSWRRQVRP